MKIFLLYFLLFLQISSQLQANVKTVYTMREVEEHVYQSPQMQEFLARQSTQWQFARVTTKDFRSYVSKGIQEYELDFNFVRPNTYSICTITTKTRVQIQILDEDKSLRRPPLALSRLTPPEFDEAAMRCISNGGGYGETLDFDKMIYNALDVEPKLSNISDENNKLYIKSAGGLACELSIHNIEAQTLFHRYRCSYRNHGNEGNRAIWNALQVPPIPANTPAFGRSAIKNIADLQCTYVLLAPGKANYSCKFK